MNTQLITRTISVGYSYNVIQHLELKKCPHCQGENPIAKPDGSVICGDCGYHFTFNSTPKSQLDYAKALYYTAGAYDHQDFFEAALPLYEQAEEIFLKELENKEEPNLIYSLAQIHFARAKDLLVDDTQKALQEFDTFLQWMERFAKARGQDPAACFIVSRTYLNTATELNGISPVIGYLNSSLEWINKARGSGDARLDDFLFNLRQDTLLHLANALNNPEEEGYDPEQAREMYLELSEILETCRLEPEHFSVFDRKESYAPSVFIQIAEGAGSYARALKESGESERIAFMFQRAMEQARRCVRYFETPVAIEALMQVYQDAFDFYRQEKDYEAARDVMEKRAALWKGSLFKDFDFHIRHDLMAQRMDTNRLLADLFHESGQKEEEEKAYKANINFLSRAKKSYQGSYSYLEEVRAFRQMEARFDLGAFYFRENRLDQAIRTFQSLLNEFDSFLESYPGSIYIKSSSLFPEKQLIRRLLELFQKLDPAELERKPAARLLSQAKALQEKLEQVKEQEEIIPIINPHMFEDWD